MTYRKTPSRGTNTRRPARGTQQRRVATQQGERRYFLGIRRLWWVVVCVIVTGLVGSVPVVGTAFGIVVIIGMIVVLALSRPRSTPS